jgi:hypothetical protein
MKSKVSVYLQGGLGNRLFQIAFLYAYAKKHNKNMGYTNQLHNTHSSINYNDHVYPFLRQISLNNPLVYNEPGDKCQFYLDIPNIEKDCYFRGYFQNEKYFKEYRKDLLSLIELPQLNFDVNKESIFIHVRRGDYVNLPMHYIDLWAYYSKGLDIIIQNKLPKHLYVISDDISFCKETGLFESKFQKNQITYVENLNELETMKLMTLCEYGGICSNSSFSWWGSYLNDSNKKMIIFPSKWFNQEPHSSFPLDIWFEGSYVLDIQNFQLKQI